MDLWRLWTIRDPDFPTFVALATNRAVEIQSQLMDKSTGA